MVVRMYFKVSAAVLIVLTAEMTLGGTVPSNGHSTRINQDSQHQFGGTLLCRV